MSKLGLVQANESGDIIRVAHFPHEFALYRNEPAADTVVVSLGAGDNDAKLQDIAENSREYKIVGGVVKKGTTAITFDPGGDAHAAARSLHGVSDAQERTMLSGARAVIEKASTPGATNVEKAIGHIVLRLMELED